MEKTATHQNRINTMLAKHGWIAAAALFVALAWRIFVFTDRYAVNVLMWDQWDFYGPLFRNEGLWAAFDYQHGPHRQGIGFLVTEVLASLSHWNSRWDAFGVCVVLVAGCVAGIILARKCGVQGWALAFVPVFFFNLRQYEMFVIASNISHGAMPMLLCMGLLLCWFIPNQPLRLAATALLTFLCIFTGFAIFLGLITPVLLLVELVHRWRDARRREALAPLLALAAIGGAWFLFSYNYHFSPAVSGYRFPYEKPHEYFLLVAAMLNNFHGLKCNTPFLTVIGCLFLAAQMALAACSGWNIARNPKTVQVRTVAIFVLSTFTLIYGASTAIGRVFTGWQEAGQSSRYVTLMVPAGMATMLHLSADNERAWKKWALLGYFLFLIYNTIFLHTGDWRTINYFSDGRAAWRRAFRETHDQGKANAETGFLVYPAPIAEEKLNFLRDHQLNVFSNRDTAP